MKPTPNPEWLSTHGMQIIELIAGFGFDVSLTLRALLEVSTGGPLSDPPKWCDTGCDRSNEGTCSLFEGELDLADTARMILWQDSHDWQLGQPVRGILYDCPAYQNPA